jgi:7-carboxy-7-deazaguanine synthase
LASCLRDGPADTILKIVIFTEDDYQFARQVHALFPGVPMCLQAGNANPTGDEPGDVLAMTRWLVERALRDTWTAHRLRILPQLHVLLWGNRRGV